VRRRDVRVAALTLLALVAGVAGCSDQAGDGTATGAPGEDGDDTSSPFVVDPAAVPDGFTPAAAGTGELVQDWGSDSFGTNEPFTVLAPPGTGADDDHVVIVSTTGFEGYQGGLEQASASYMDADVESFDYEGRPALYVPPSDEALDDPAGGPRAGWADLVAERGDDVAVRVSARGAGRDALLGVLDHVVVPDDHTAAPDVVRPPAGMEVLGSGDADLVLSAFPGFDAVGRRLWVAESAHAVGFAGGPAGTTTTVATTTAVPSPSQLVVATLPGDAGDVEAVGAPGTLGGYGEVTAQDVDGGVDGRPAVVLDRTTEGDPSVARTLVTTAPWGDVLLVAAVGPAGALPDADDLVAVAAATTRADEAAFAAQAPGPAAEATPANPTTPATEPGG
jgi:hypothetical protein